MHTLHWLLVAASSKLQKLLEPTYLFSENIIFLSMLFKLILFARYFHAPASFMALVSGGTWRVEALLPRRLLVDLPWL